MKICITNIFNKINKTPRHIKIKFLFVIIICFSLSFTYSLISNKNVYAVDGLQIIPPISIVPDVKQKRPQEQYTDLIEQIIVQNNAQLKNQHNIVKLYAFTTYKEAVANNLDPLFLAAIITTESHWRANTVSSKNAVGLGQITPITAKELRVNHNDMFDPIKNIAASAKYLAKLQNEFHRHDLVAAAYNAGPTKVRSLGRIPKYTETLNYVNKVTSQHNQYHNQAVIQNIR